MRLLAMPKPAIGASNQAGTDAPFSRIGDRAQMIVAREAFHTAPISAYEHHPQPPQTPPRPLAFFFFWLPLPFVGEGRREGRLHEHIFPRARVIPH
jgi:hypothetical protein